MTRAKQKHAGGRPVEIDARKNINYRVDDYTLKAIEELAKRWKCSKSEAVRKAIRDAQQSGR